MNSRIRNLTGWSLFAAYGGIALLGHAGVHAVHDAGHGHSHGMAVAAGHSHSDAHGCCHHHSHSGADQKHSPPGDRDQHDHHGPGHDHDNCLICHHFAAKAALLMAAAPLNLAAGLEHRASVLSTVAAGADRYVLPIRGPPAGDC
jgi:hypothetical protein